MTEQKDDHPLLGMPIKNFKYVGELTEDAVEWWLAYGRHLEAAQRDWDRSK